MAEDRIRRNQDDIDLDDDLVEDGGGIAEMPADLDEEEDFEDEDDDD